LPLYLAQKQKKKKTAQLLKEAEANQARAETDEEFRKKMLLENALKRAKGEKVKDDPKLLKKTLKKEMAKKKKSAKEWAKRKKDLKKEMAEKQQQRSENIRQHLEAKKLSQLSHKVTTTY
jgi:hypothetical protein